MHLLATLWLFPNNHIVQLSATTSGNSRLADFDNCREQAAAQNELADTLLSRSSSAVRSVIQGNNMGSSSNRSVYNAIGLRKAARRLHR